MFDWLHHHLWGFLVPLSYLLSWVAVPHVLLSSKRPVSALAWIWGIILFPIIGVLTYFLVGAEKIKSQRFRKLGKFQRASREEEPVGDDEETRSLLHTLAGVTEHQSSQASEVEFLLDAAAFYPRLLAEIAAAEHHVHVLFFIWRDDDCGKKLLDALILAVRRGVKVRVLVDKLGSLTTGNNFFDPLVEAGGQFAWFSTLDLLRNRFFLHLRNHRKLQIVDGRVAFVGGMNMGREYEGRDPEVGRWRDAQLRLKGRVLEQLQEVFAQDWFYATGERLLHPTYYPSAESTATGRPAHVIAGGPDLATEPMLKSWLAMLFAARQRLWLSAGYFTPDVSMLQALELAALRGADVRIILAAQSDHKILLQVGRSYYQELLAAGVRIFEFQKGMHHAKVMTMDGEWGMVGSANFDIRSMRLNFELNVAVSSRQLAQEIEQMLEADFLQSREIKLSQFHQQALPRRLLEGCFRLLAPLL